jgi:phenylalanyl-tRNA synthetase alpha chain
MHQDIDAIRSSFNNDIQSINSLNHLEEIRVQYLGRKGSINQLFGQITSLSNDEKRTFASGLNTLKQEIEEALSEKEKTLQANERERLDKIDTTIPGIKPQLGHLHPTTEVMRSINSFFRYHGYSVYEGPEIETNEFNFEKLNLPKDHPARALQDTLYIQNPDVLLRTHTSSVETRAMTTEKLPLRIVVPGKVYRNETANSTNNSVFYQYEGLVVDKNINMAELKWTLHEFLKFLYGKDVKTRMRCKYYPQVEPGAGMDIQCTFCNGVGCSVCKYRGWVEVLGSGMVHPNVLKACNIDPEEWSGFAFGLGLDRLVMLKYGIDDVRALYSGGLVYVSI